jgi:DNA-binding MarR family transcriptional regulator
LTSTEADVVRAAGVFRTVHVSDLLKGVYWSDERALDRELNRLEAQHLITTSSFRGRPRERFVTLTPEAKRLADTHLKSSPSQQIYSGMAKVRELEHDAALYRMYLKACEGIRAEDGHPVRVILDYELKKSLNRDLEAIQKLPPDSRDARLAELASAHKLTVVNGKIPVPDVRIEYETREGDRAHLDLEYVTGNYRSEAIAAKARAGFSLYAPAGFERSSGGAAGRRVKNEYPSLAAEIVSL